MAEAVIRRFSLKKGVPKSFAELTEKDLYQSFCFNKVACLRPAFLFKKRLWYRCFNVNFAKFLRTPFYRTPPMVLVMVSKINQELYCRTFLSVGLMCVNQIKQGF